MYGGKGITPMRSSTGSIGREKETILPPPSVVASTRALIVGTGWVLSVLALVPAMA